MRGWETEMIPLDLCKRPWSMVLDNLVKGEFSRHSLWTSFEIGPVGDWLISLNMQKIYYLDYTSSCWCINGEGSHHHKWWINLKKRIILKDFASPPPAFYLPNPIRQIWPLKQTVPHHHMGAWIVISYLKNVTLGREEGSRVNTRASKSSIGTPHSCRGNAGSGPVRHLGMNISVLSQVPQPQAIE